MSITWNNSTQMGIVFYLLKQWRVVAQVPRQFTSSSGSRKRLHLLVFPCIAFTNVQLVLYMNIETNGERVFDNLTFTLCYETTEKSIQRYCNSK